MTLFFFNLIFYYWRLDVLLVGLFLAFSIIFGTFQLLVKFAKLFNKLIFRGSKTRDQMINDVTRVSNTRVASTGNLMQKKIIHVELEILRLELLPFSKSVLQFLPFSRSFFFFFVFFFFLDSCSSSVLQILLLLPIFFFFFVLQSSSSSSSSSSSDFLVRYIELEFERLVFHMDKLYHISYVLGLELECQRLVTLVYKVVSKT